MAGAIHDIADSRRPIQTKSREPAGPLVDVRPLQVAMHIAAEEGQLVALGNVPIVGRGNANNLSTHSVTGAKKSLDGCRPHRVGPQ